MNTSTEKRFTVAGSSSSNGTSKARFANDFATRIKILTNAGHTNIELVELPTPMTKSEAVEYLLANGASINANIDLVAVENKSAAIAGKVRRLTAKAALKTGKGVKAAKPAAKPKTATKPAKATVKTVSKKTGATTPAVETAEPVAATA